MTADLARLLRRWASASEQQKRYVRQAIEANVSNDAGALDLLEEAARVGTELEGQHARAVANKVRFDADVPYEVKP